VPTPATAPPRGARRTHDAGWDGRDLLDRVCDAAPSVLRRGGRLLLVHSALCDPERTLARLRETGFDAAVGRRRHVPLGPVMRQRLSWLRALGLVPEDSDAEELVVVHARRR
ncbi:methyltransferase, partial [Streptomyces durbertensis]|nr:methyltransferase [Streptomyces durbertensis]